MVNLYAANECGTMLANLSNGDFNSMYLMEHGGRLSRTLVIAQSSASRHGIVVTTRPFALRSALASRPTTSVSGRRRATCSGMAVSSG